MHYFKFAYNLPPATNPKYKMYLPCIKIDVSIFSADFLLLSYVLQLLLRIPKMSACQVSSVFRVCPGVQTPRDTGKENNLGPMYPQSL